MSGKMDPFLIEQKDPEYKNRSLGGRINFSALDELSFLEIPSFSSSPKLVDDKIQEGRIEVDGVLQQWLSKVINQPSPIGSESLLKGSKGGLRLLYGKCSWNSKSGLVLPMTETAFKSIEESLGLPDSFLEIMKGKGSRAMKYTSKGLNGNPRVCFVFKFGLFQPSYYQLALSYYPKTSLTTGLLLSKNPEFKIPELVEHLKISPLASSQPLYLAALLTEVVVDSSNDRIQIFVLSLAKLEEAMGQHEYINLPLGDPLKLDLMKATRRLNFFVRNFTIEIMRLGSMLLILEQIQQHRAYIGRSRESGKAEIDFDTLGEDMGEQMDEKIAYLKNACQNTLLRAEFQIKLAQSLIQVVFHFIAYKNAKSNITLGKNASTIAIDTKKDGASMKTIALMGMVFLPSTDRAAVFAMPVFDWNARGASILKPGFGYYIAVAVPLTCVVLLIWGLGMRRGQKDGTPHESELNDL